jgi:hypothetical protein
MAVINGYTTLLTAVSDWLARSDLTTFAPNYVQNWEEKFYRQPRNFGAWMETSALAVAFTSTAVVPTDFLALRIAYLNGQMRKPLIASSIDQLYTAYPRSGTSGIPKWIARDGANFVFGPTPSASFTLNGTYYAKPILLRNAATDAAAHWLILNAPDLCLYGSLLEAAPMLRDPEQTGIWSQMYQQAAGDYRDLMRKQDHSGGSMQTLVA